MRVQKLFYRATPCVSAVFIVGRCPSVRHVRVLYCIQTAEDIIKHLSRPGSPMILVFDPQALIPNSRRTPSSGVQNTVCDFGLKSPFISDTVGDRPVVATER